MCSKTVAIALGSNIGNRLQMLRRAMQSLSASGFRLTAASRVWETAPWGIKEQGRFLNMCVLAETCLTPKQILDTMKKIERQLGRKKGLRWGPREIDLDIILIGEEVVDTPDLHVPHASMHERAFVLVPLAEIAPDMVHPILHKTVRQLAQELSVKEEMDWIITI